MDDPLNKHDQVSKQWGPLLRDMEELQTWNDLFDLSVEQANPSLHLIDLISETFEHEIQECMKQSVDRFGSSLDSPCGFVSPVSYEFKDGTDRSFSINVFGAWRGFEAKHECYLVNGSYNITDEEFAGSISTPSMDMHSTDPGDGWTPLDQREMGTIRPTISIFRYGGSIRETLRSSVGGQYLRPSAGRC